MVHTPGGLQSLDTLTTSIMQVTAALSGFGSLFALAMTLRAQLRATGATTQEARQALDSLDAAIGQAMAVNEAWLAAHPRTEEL